MRITTQMLANSAAKNGMPLHRTSLLDIINNKSSSNLLSGIGSKTNASHILNKNNYSKLEDAAECKETLKNIGITQAKDGSLSVDEKVLESADVDTLKKALGSESGFAPKVSFVSNRIKENAAANIASASNQYTAKGSAYTNSFEANKYNFFG